MALNLSRAGKCMFAIIRTQKLKTFGAIARSGRHSFREQPTPNASSALTSKNLVSGCKDTNALIQAFNNRLPCSRRRDAVLCIEYLITASPEAFARHGGHLDDLGSGYFRDALAWLRHRHGTDNVISAVIHLDESTPHLVAYAIPLTKDGRLSARDFLGGPQVMRKLQDSFYDACGQQRGLMRGVKGSKAQHSDIAKFYSTLAAEGRAPNLSAKDYAAKALGFETQAWKGAQAASEAQAKIAAVESLTRKANRSRANALRLAERDNLVSSLEIQENERKLNKRERDIERRESQLAGYKPALDTALARAEAAERLLDERRTCDRARLLRTHIRSLDLAPRFG